MRRCVSSCEMDVVFGSFFLGSMVLGQLQAAAAGIQQLANPQHGGHSTLQHVGQRRFAAEDRICVRQLDPGIRELGSIENVESLKDAHEEGYARELVLI